MSTEFKSRHPLLVLVWSFGILIAMNLQRYLGAAIGSLVAGVPFHSIMGGKAHDITLSFAQGVVALVLGIPLAYLAVIYLWRRSLDWMRLRFDGRLAAGGFLLGLILPLAVLAWVSFFADVRVVAKPSRLSGRETAMILSGTFCWILFIGFTEETVFRGIAVREWASRWGWIVATILGGLYFAVMHLPGLGGESPILSAFTVLISGTAVTSLFVALYVRGRSLWLPIGFHIGWNLTLQGILGVTISGHQPGFALYQMNVSGPDWLTGGAFGIEASMIAIGVYLLTALAAIRVGRTTRGQLLCAKLAVP